MNHSLATEEQCASQDLERKTRKCVIFSSFYCIIFILNQIPEQAASPFTNHLLALKHHPVSQH